MSAHKADVEMWLSKAANDMLNIENNLHFDEVPWDTICFHAQQAVEKTLKALLVSKGVTAPRIHDLVVLLTHVAHYEPTVSDLEEDCRNLTYFAVNTRYPDDLFEPDETDGRSMVEAAKRVRAYVLPRIR